MKTKSFLKNLKEKSLAQLEQQLKETRFSLANNKLGLSQNRLKNYQLIKNTRRQIARILTTLGQKHKEATYE